MTGRRRRLRASCLRVLRGLRRHHLSLVTAVVLLVALAIALTDGGFGNPSAATESEANVQTPPVSPGRIEASAPSLPSGSVVYYIVESPEQIDLLRTTLFSDALYMAEQGMPPPPQVWTYFLIFETPEEEAYGAHFLNQFAATASSEGFNFTVIDLTR